MSLSWTAEYVDENRTWKLDDILQITQDRTNETKLSRVGVRVFKRTIVELSALDEGQKSRSDAHFQMLELTDG